MATFGDRLRAKRRESGLTQEELGMKVGLQKSAVAKYENGRIRNISTDIAIRFAEALGISVHDLLDSFERNLYALDFKVSETDISVSVQMEDQPTTVVFTKEEWAHIKEEARLAPVLRAFQIAERPDKKRALAEISEGLPEDRRYLIEKIMSLSDDEVRSLRAIVDQVLQMRGK